MQRVVTPLWLTYDPDGDVFGFHRIFFPRDDESIPPAPYGLRLIQQLLSEGQYRAKWRVVYMAHHETLLEQLPKKLRARLKKVARSLERVNIEFAAVGDGRTVTIDALWVVRSDGTEGLACLFEENELVVGADPCDPKKKQRRR